MPEPGGPSTRVSGDIYAQLVQAVRDYAIIALDPQGLITTWNEGAARLKGYAADEVIGHHFSRFFTPEDIERGHPQHELDSAALNGVYEEEAWRVRKDGSRFWASVVVTALRDEYGGLKGFGKVVRDLTERKQAEQARLDDLRKAALLAQVRENERILDQLFSEAPSFMTLLSVPDYRYIKSNDQHLKLIRKTDFIGKTVAEVEPEMVAQGIIELLNEVVRTGRPYIGKEVPIYYAATPDQPAKTSYLDFVYQPLRQADGVIYAIAVQGYEVTEAVLARKAVENERENFRNLFMQTPEMVCILHGPDHVFEFVNEAHIRTLGFDATGMAVRVAQPESVEVHGILDEVYRTGRTAELREIAVTVTGRRRYFNLTYAARRDEAGRINGIMILGVEITERKQAEYALAAARQEAEDARQRAEVDREKLALLFEQSRRSEEEARKAVRVRDDFLSIASHELKTPLTSLKMHVQMRLRNIQQGKLAAFSEGNLQRLMKDDERQINRLVRLVDDILEVSRINSSKVTLRPELFDLAEMARETLTRLAPQMESIGCMATLTADGPVPGSWDRFRLEQVLINLLSNAMKYGAGQPVELVVRADGDTAELRVIDHGRGIAPQDHARIFAQFERAVSATDVSGLGLGLFIAKNLVEAHGGTIHVDSEVGRGATFTVRLPQNSSSTATPA